MEAYEYYKKETGKLYYKEAALELELTDDYINWLEQKLAKLFAIPDVSGSAQTSAQIAKETLDFAEYLVGHDQDTIKAMYRDWKRRT